MVGDADRGTAMMLAEVLTSVVGWLLDLERIRLGHDAPVRLSWHWILPAWVMVPLCLGLCVVVFSIGRRESASRAGRAVVTTLRGVTIGLIVLLFSQPVLTLQRERVEPAHVAVVVDTSASMGLTDGGVTRIKALRSALMSNDLAAVSAMLKQNEVRFYSFASNASVIRHITTNDDVGEMMPVVETLASDGRTTDLAGVMRSVFSHGAGRVAAVVVLSDGRSTGSVRVDELVAEAQSRQVPVHTVLLGSPIPKSDVLIESVNARESVFLRDSVAVNVEVGSRGLSERRSIEIVLRDAGEQPLATETMVVDPDEAKQLAVLRFTPLQVGRQSLRVEVTELPDEIDTSNNLATLELNVIDRQMRVLYVDGGPRYEYRYLKNALLREPTIRSSCLLLKADEGYAQEGTDPIDVFPATADELNAYDVVIMGDVDPTDDRFGMDRLEMLRSFVLDRGGGVVFLAGPESMPFALRGTELESVLPVRLGVYDQADSLVYSEAVGLSLTVDGRDDELFRLEVQEEGIGVESWAGAYWVPPALEPKAGAIVLAERETSGGVVPTVVKSRVGAGRALYVGTDETWRWRQGGNDWLLDAFWLQVCRSMAGVEAGSAQNRYELTTDRREYSAGEDVQVMLKLWQTDGLLSDDQNYRVVAIDPYGDAADEVWLGTLGEDGRLFEGAFVPNRTGVWRLKLEDASVETTFQVSMVNAEFERPEADHDTLRSMAALTGGRAVAPEELLDVAGNILNRSVSIPDDISEPLWDSKLVFALFAMLISTEWICRKAWGMV